MLTVCLKTINLACHLFWIKKYDENVIYFQDTCEDDVDEYNIYNDNRSAIKIHGHGDNCITDFEMYNGNIYAIRDDMLVCKNIKTEYQKIFIHPNENLRVSKIIVHNNLIYIIHTLGRLNYINTI